MQSGILSSLFFPFSTIATSIKLVRSFFEVLSTFPSACVFNWIVHTLIAIGNVSLHFTGL